ncbi:YraN family protein [Bacteroidales bacterium]|nr:YraN family protein [Bacteroidales bacterium]
MNTKLTGDTGETMAYEYLRNKGFEILATNWTFKHKEIDLIAQKNETLHIVEVKTRSYDSIVRPEDAVTRKKQKYLIQAANAYLETRNDDPEILFDIITIIINKHSQKIEFIEDAFYPLLR